ncbi:MULTISPECIES: PDR/VanB family oxidoreductase [unclassified Microbacterium]|uniref:PDR/VanB family oxidoreductase n=1 Tax=unclassified Microbacterium TaxID=2609290 RepID=UPI001FCEE712|nr:MULTISPECIES: PDR/VanB family oxidoreductase [unclassified Microbacterium]
MPHTAVETPEQRFTLRVRAMRQEARDVLSLELDAPDGAELPAWEPGAHIDLRFANGVERQYSLCSDPDDRTMWRVAVLAESPSRGGSRHVHQSLRVGDLVTVSAPINHFALAPDAEYVFIAGGIGITPILPMLADATRRGVPWRLAYLGSAGERMAFLSAPQLAGGETLLVRGDTDDRLDLAAWIGAPAADTGVYACGPERMLDALEQLSADWPRGVLHVERFQAKTFGESQGADSFEVVARRSDLVVTVDRGCSILEMLENAGIGVPSSCLEGVCGTCETAVIDGAPEHRDSVLTPDERESNETMMICVSRSLGDRLVLDI